MSVSVIWPAPLLPALVDGPQQTIELIVSSDDPSHEAIRSWAANLALRDAASGDRVALQSLELLTLKLSDVPRYARAGAAIAASAGKHLARLCLATAGTLTPPLPQRARVFDLVRADTVLRPRAAAARRAGASVLRIAFASDLHVAATWDEIAAAVERHAPRWRPHLFHPMELLWQMAEELTVLARSGDLDLLVLGGDLVDHVYRRPNGGGGVEATNVPLLLPPLSRLPVPIYAIPGNHDYRLYPWRPRVYPFSSVGLPPPEAARVMRKAGMWDIWPVRACDLDALRTSEGDGEPALRHHLAMLAPATDFTVDFGKLRLIFLGTGCDVLSRWRTVERGRLGMLLRSLPVSYHHPDCEGLSEEQVDDLQASLRDCSSAVLFFHAPLLNVSGRLSRLPRLDAGSDGGLKARIGFERRLFKSGARHGVFFRNPALFLRALESFPGHLATFSGHIHAGTAIQIDRCTKAARRLSLRQVGAEEGPVLLTAPAVGQTATRAGESAGYLLACFEDGRLASVERRVLKAFPTIP